MKIDTSLKQRNNMTFSGAKRKKAPTSEQDQSHDDFLDLSSEAIILNQLLDHPDYQFTPLPFYFPDASARNIKNAYRIARNIQQKALVFGFNLNYNMIYDLLIAKTKSKASNEMHWIRAENENSSQNAILLDQEKQFFESLYYKFKKRNISVAIIDSIVIEYSKRIQINKPSVESPTIRSNELVNLLNDESKFAQLELTTQVIEVIKRELAAVLRHNSHNIQ